MTNSTKQLLRRILYILFISESCEAIIDSVCDFKQNILPGKTYYISSPNYPIKYFPYKSCRWHALSNTRIRFICYDFHMAASPNCDTDSFNIFSSHSFGAHRYCGSGNFRVESENGEMIITLNISSSSARFNCTLETIEDNECKCGWKNSVKIVGGEETGINEYPMMAGIIKITTQQVHCGATIVSHQHVLTAAHCLNGLMSNNLGVLVGDHDITTGLETNASKLYKVENYLTHPLYVSNIKDYDIAVITVFGTILFTNEVGPVCLPFQHYLDSFDGSYVDILGWGTTEFAGIPSNTLHKVRLSVISSLICKQYFPNIEYRHICAYSEGKDACQFDSGGPVLWQNPTSRQLLLIGIVSYGSFCASSHPAVNTRVGMFIDWIAEVTQGASYCQNE